MFTSNKTKQDGCLRAEVVFADEESMHLALDTPSSLNDARQPCQQSSAIGPKVGVQKWLREFHRTRPKGKTLQMQVDRFMEAFDKRELQARAAAESGPLVDDEGWTIVRSASKRRRLLLPKGVEEQGRKKKKKNVPILNFYKHQQIQKKRDQLAELRRKFEQDKERLARQTASRKFNPF
jgi:ribosomal RNA-processing protein 7